MNYFDKNRLIIAFVILITIINLASLGTIVFMMSHRNDSEMPPPPPPEMKRDIMKKQSTNMSDFRLMDSVRGDIRNKIMPIHYNLKRVQSEMMQELSEENPDTLILDSLAVESSMYYLQMKKSMIRDFVRLNRRCNPAERQRLNRFYHRYMLDGRGDNEYQREGMNREKRNNRRGRLYRNRNNNLNGVENRN